MKDGVEEILGKTIAGVIIKKNTTGSISPAQQLFLLFDDGQGYEFYSSGSIYTTSCIRFNSLHDIYNYMDPAMEIYYQSIKDPDSNKLITGYVNR